MVERSNGIVLPFSTGLCDTTMIPRKYYDVAVANDVNEVPEYTQIPSGTHVGCECSVSSFLQVRPAPRKWPVKYAPLGNLDNSARGIV